MDIKPLEEMNVKELQEELTKMGHGSIAETLKERKQLLAVISGMKTNPANPENIEIPKAEYVETASQDRKDQKAWRTKAQRMRDKLAAQEKTQVFLPLEGKEQPGNVEERIVNGRVRYTLTGSVETVTLNGWPTYIPKGRPWKVPSQVAEVLGQSMTETAQAGREFELDRMDTTPGNTHLTVGEALQ